MASLPTANDIRELLEGYYIDASIVSDDWIEKRRDNFVVPWVEKVARTSITGVQEVTDYYSGNGENILILHRKNVKSLSNIQFVVGGGTWVFNISNVELIADEGIIKAKRNFQETWIKPYFPKGHKNIKVTYTVGYAVDDLPSDLAEAIAYFTAEKTLSMVASRCGGGNVSVTGYSTTYGPRGKFSDYRNELARMGHAILKQYTTSIVGNT